MAEKGRSRRGGQQQKIGLERIERLFELAEREFRRHPERSHRNVLLARKIAMRYNIRLPQRLKRRFCKKCYKYLPLNMNCDGGMKRGSTTIKCPACGHVNKCLG